MNNDAQHIYLLHISTRALLTLKHHQGGEGGVKRFKIEYILGM